MNGCADFWRTQRMSRRAMLRAGGASLLGLTLPGLLRAETEAGAAQAAGRVAGGGRPTARSVILLFNFGGASHLETFDMKPEGATDSRGEFRPIPTNVPGIQICELLPQMARIADRYAIIRSVHHKMGNHNSAACTALTGFMPARDDINLRDSPEQMPAYGSVVSRFRPADNGMPSFVAMPSVIRDATQSPGQHGGYLGKQHDPLLILKDPNSTDFQLPELSLPEEVSVERLQDRRSLLKLLDGQARRAELAAAAGLDTYQERAFSMLGSPQVKAAFDIGQEKDAVRE